MTHDVYADVVAFHRKFGLADETVPFEPGPRVIPDGYLEFRRKFMQEELDEFIEGMREGNHAKMFDALLDLTYVAAGTALGMGYP